MSSDVVRLGEGYHQHLLSSKCALAAGLEWTEAVTNKFDWRWVVRAVRTAGLLPSWVRHYNLSLIEYLYGDALAASRAPSFAAPVAAGAVIAPCVTLSVRLRRAHVKPKRPHRRRVTPIE